MDAERMMNLKKNLDTKIMAIEIDSCSSSLYVPYSRYKEQEINSPFYISSFPPFTHSFGVWLLLG
jgi:hypothetical protein